MPLKVSDGYITGATVFADTNNNGVRDAGEPSTVTDAAGDFAIDSGGAPLVVIGGSDIATGLPFQGHLNASPGSTVVTPLTTLIVALTAEGVVNAQAQVNAAFGFDPATDVTTLDPIAGTSGGGRGSGTGLHRWHPDVQHADFAGIGLSRQWPQQLRCRL
jgi:hypothetical protein